jgi:hypothetical protein
MIFAAQGFYPASICDEDGTPNFRWLPGHPWQLADDDAGRWFDALVQSTRVGYDFRSAADMYGLDHESLGHRWRKIAERRGDPAKALREAEREVEGGADVTLLALRMGIVPVDKSKGVPQDHPAALVYRAERQAERRAAKAS